MISLIKQKINVDKRLLLIYIVIYFLWGIGMDAFGTYAQIARFTYWWQVITVYILYMVPISLLLRDLKWYEQYAYGVISMGVLEFGGYTLGTSIAYQNNILDQFFTERNFALAMTMFFGLYYPVGNWGVGRLHQMIFRDRNQS